MTPFLKAQAARLAAMHNDEIRRWDLFHPDLRAVLAREQLRPNRPKPTLPRLKILEQDDGAG